MRRSREWWAALSRTERSWLVIAERQPSYKPMGGDLPDDCSYCPVCGYPLQGSGWCWDCIKRHQTIIAKAETSYPRG